jgi:predicted GH43/DUF377 family glycosyl hydrolase
MKFKWEKKGLIYVAKNESDEKFSYGKSRAIMDMGTFLRAYTLCYSKPTTNGDVSCRTFILDLDRRDPLKIIYNGNKPVLELGNLGEFDHHGVMIESVIKVNQVFYAFYDGWSRKIGVPYDWAIGLAVSEDNGLTFKRKFRGPIIGSGLNEPYLFAAPEVLKINDNSWHMWYLGGDSWKEYEKNDGLYSTYTIKHAFSKNGIDWQRDGKQIIECKMGEECQAGPTVFENDGLYHMIFCYRDARRRDSQGNYDLGYAYSADLINWVRKDELLNMKKSDSGWDSKMMCYPRILKVEEKVLLFYSGNDNGREGFGYAEMAI